MVTVGFEDYLQACVSLIVLIPFLDDNPYYIKISYDLFSFSLVYFVNEIVGSVHADNN